MTFFKKHCFFISLAILALNSCSPLSVFNNVNSSSGYSKYYTASYGDNPRQALDVYIPKNPSEDKKVIVFIYGGRWTSGSKNDYSFAAQAFTSQGFITVIPDYRIYPEVYFPEFLYDSASAIKWVRENINEFGGDPDKIYLVGHSAGAYNAVMLAINKTYLEKIKGDTKWIKGVAGIAGPYDFLPFTDEDIKDLFSTAKNEIDTQPITYADKDHPPLLLLHGEKDTTVWPKNTKNLAKKLEAKGNPAKVILYPEVDHADILIALSSYFYKKGPILKDIVDFIKAN